jgi:hypothetical protein
MFVTCHAHSRIVAVWVPTEHCASRDPNWTQHIGPTYDLEELPSQGPKTIVRSRHASGQSTGYKPHNPTDEGLEPRRSKVNRGL